MSMGGASIAGILQGRREDTSSIATISNTQPPTLPPPPHTTNQPQPQPTNNATTTATNNTTSASNPYPNYTESIVEVTSVLYTGTAVRILSEFGFAETTVPTHHPLIHHML